MRAMWTGSIAFGLVNVPVKLVKATEDHTIKGRQVHNKDGGQIRYVRVCEDCGEQVEYRDIVTAYEHCGQTVTFTTDDYNSIKGEKDDTIQVLAFIPAGSIDAMMYEGSFYLEPATKSAKSYVLFALALSKSDRVAITRFTMRGRTYLAELRVDGERIVAHALRWTDEVRPVDYVVPKVEVSAEEVKMASKLIKSLVNDNFNLADYTDSYQVGLAEKIEQKANGDETTEVSDLLAKLTASTKKKKEKVSK